MASVYHLIYRIMQAKNNTHYMKRTFFDVNCIFFASRASVATECIFASSASRYRDTCLLLVGKLPNSPEPRFCSDPNCTCIFLLYFSVVTSFDPSTYSCLYQSDHPAYGSSDRIYLCNCHIVSIISCNNLKSSA